MNRTKRILSLLLACVLLVGMLAVPAGASGSSEESTHRADQLASLGLFQGTGGGYQLDAVPTRIQGLVMLLRLLGLEDEALAYTDPSPFTDVSWGDNYVAYAYFNGLTNGTSGTTFSPNTTLNANGYVTFLLRALGYSDAEGDFSWSDALSFARDISMMDASSASTLAKVTMNRGDMVDLSYAALTCPVKDGSQTLAQHLVDQGVFTADAAASAGVMGGRWTYTYVPYDNSTITYEVKNLAGVTAHVFTVNTHNPKVEVHASVVNGVVGSTAPFSTIVNNSGGAKLVMNANFFNAGSTKKTPNGHVIADGQLMYINSGYNCLGITADGDLMTGRPGMFVRVKASSGKEWSAYEMNTAAQSDTYSNLYSRAYGSSVTFKVAGNALVIDNGVITNYYSVAAGESVAIPANGYVMFMGPKFTATSYFQQPTVGESVIIEPYLLKEDAEGFQIENVTDLIAGGPRLVQDGAIYTELEAPFTEERFTTIVSPRTAAGISADGKLILVSVPGGAKIQQMRELMLALGCVDAINLDGGASCGMYYDGKYIATPGREITTTLRVYVNP